MEAGIEAFFDWLSAFGTGAKGFLLVGMVLTAVVAAWCIPKMFKAYLDYKKSTDETKLEVKRIDREIVDKFETLSEKGLVKVEKIPDGKEKS